MTSRRRRGGYRSSRPSSAEIPEVLDALGWPPPLIRGVTLLGTRVSVAVSVDLDAHLWRLESDCAYPILDPDDLKIFEWPVGKAASPPTAVAVVGAISHEGHLTRDRLTNARKWRGFGATAVVVDIHEKPTPDLMMECAYAGIAVVQHDHEEAVNLLLAGQEGRLQTARRTLTDRWIEEQLYGRLLAEGRLPDALLV